MVDQSFSADNFRKIYDLENRKGMYLEGRFFPELMQTTEEIKQCNEEIKQKIKNKSKDGLEELNKKRNDLKKSKEEQLQLKLQEVSNKVLAPHFSLDLEIKQIPLKKPLYIVKDSPEHYFTMKQLQNNVCHLFGVKQSNRYEIISQAKLLLGDGFPKYVIKTDIDNFYESIPHEALIKKINADNLLSPFSRNVLKQIINKYRQLSGSNKGIPRGVGISAYLSELYMRDADKAIKSLPSISYYARYVDDIIIIFVPTATDRRRSYLKDIKNIIETKFKLTINNIKTAKYDLRNGNKKKEFELEYLGYKIFFGNGKVRTKFTDNKINKYKDRINLAFDNYSKLSKIDEKKARKLLVKRIRFLTGNTRLRNNKKNILIGIYYSNCQLTETDDLDRLDNYLITKIDCMIKINRLKQRLRKYDFKEGFVSKRFSPFKTHDLQEILKVWK